MTTPRIRLHIGAMKTGTTYVQRMLGRNRELLAGAGVLYPFPWSDQVVAIRDVLELKGGSHLGSAAGAWQDLVSQLHDWDGEEAIVSVEFLSFADAKQIRRIVQDLSPSEVSVVLGARDLGRVLPAQWQTAVRNGRTTTYRDYVEGVTKAGPSPSKKHFWKRQDIGRIAARWADQVGRENVVVAAVPPRGSDPAELWRRMAVALNVSGDHLEHPTPSNESLGPTATELLRRINVQAESAGMTQWAYQHGVNRALSHAVLPNIPDRHPGLAVPSTHHRWVRTESQRIIEEIVAAGVQVIGDLDDLSPDLPASDSEMWPEDLTDKELLGLAVAALTQFSQTVADKKLRESKRSGESRRENAKADES